MKSWEQTLIGPQTSLREALETIDRLGCKIALVVGPTRKLLGTLSDGDARRAMLRGLSLYDPVAQAMYSTPTCATADDTPADILTTMRRLQLHQMPVVDRDGTVVGLFVVDDYFTPPRRENLVVLMAGGLGSRLQELTLETPKPMLKVGARPLIETIVRSFADQGFVNFRIAVNYKAEQIREHFGDGRSLGVDIRYIQESERLGTAGALSLLAERPTEPIVVTNADLLTKEDFGAMVDRHIEAQAAATMAVREYEMQVPFGVVREVGGEIHGIDEKPVQRFLVSAGMYVLSPDVIDLVPAQRFYDMPTLFEHAIERGMRTRSHLVNGYWLDIGRLPDYERANLDFAEVFS